MPVNEAAWLTGKQAPLAVRGAPYTPPRPGEVVVRNRAVAVNPVDWFKQDLGGLLFPWIRYPFVLGEDLAGDVVEVGAGVTRLRVGDRVLAHAVGIDKQRNSAAEGAFQTYTVVLSHLCAPIPEAVAYENAAVLPLALSTAACALFQKDQLALRHPRAGATPTGTTVLVWGASTSVGSNAVQLAAAAGYDVVATASPRNFPYVARLGADQVLDYNGPDAVQAVVAALQDRTLAGSVAVGTGAAAACADIVHRCAGSRNVSMVTPPGAFERPPLGTVGVLALALRFARENAALAAKARLRHVRTRSVFGSTLMGNEVSRAVYENFLPAALADGRYAAAPDALVVGRGLEAVQTAFDLHRDGVSARKVVVSL